MMVRLYTIVMVLGLLFFPTLFTFQLMPSVLAEEPPIIHQSPGLPTVIIYLHEESRTAHVGPGDTGRVEFNGTVSVSLNPTTSVEVTLSAEDTWASALVSPATLTFRLSGSESFKVTVQVPALESISNPGSVTVTGRWVMTPGSINGVADPPGGEVGRVDIAQFYDFSLRSTMSQIKASPDTEVIFALTIQNNGNGEDVFKINIRNEKELLDKDFEITLTMKEVVISENPGEEIVRIQVSIPSSSKGLGQTTIQVEVRSEGGSREHLQPKEFEFVVDVPQGEFAFTSEFKLIIVAIIGLIIAGVYLFWRKRKKKRKSKKKV
jgi:hypothetical protein